MLIKVSAIELLKDEPSRKRKKSIIGTGSMNDPYMPLEEEVQLTRRTLETIPEHGFGVHVITNSDLVIRDIDVLRKISRVSAAVSLTITTADDEVSKKVEPGTPPSSARLCAMHRLSKAGIERVSPSCRRYRASRIPGRMCLPSSRKPIVAVPR